jgi:hypothetical protein
MPDTLSFYVCSLRVRRELIPVEEKSKLVAYRCVTHRADGPVDDTDKVIADQVEFEDVLIGMKLMPPRNGPQLVLAGFWRGLSIDKLTDQRPPEGKSHETLLRITP